MAPSSSGRTRGKGKIVWKRDLLLPPDNARSTYYGIIVNVFRPRLCHLVKFQSSRPIVAAQTVAITGQLSHLRPPHPFATLRPSHPSTKPLILRYFRRVTRNTEGNRGKQRASRTVVCRLDNHLHLLPDIWLAQGDVTSFLRFIILFPRDM